MKKQAAEGRNPRDIKFELARELVARFHDEAAALAAQEAFISRFAKGEIPDDIEEITLSGITGIAHVLKEAGLVDSTSEAFRQIKQGAVKIDGEKVDNKDLQLPAGFSGIVQVGKRRIARVSIA